MQPNAVVPSSIQEYLNQLPEFKSDDRIESLYSDFSASRQSNPAGFQSNNATWQIILTDLLSYGLQPPPSHAPSNQLDPNQHHPATQDAPDRLVLHLNQQFIESLRRQSVGKPYGLACPLWTLSSLSTSPSLATFAPLSAFISTGGWGPSSASLTTTISRSISWVSRTLTRGSLLDPDQRFDQLDLDQKLRLIKIDWVHLLLLQQAADRVIERYQGNFVGLSPRLDCLYTHSQFKDQLTTNLFPSTQPNLTLSTTDLRVLIKHLERDRRVLVSERDVVKFVLPKSIESDREGHTYSTVGPPPINQLDRGILSVKHTIQQLNQQIQALGVQIDQQTQQAKKYLQLAQPEMASSRLKSRKNLRQVLAKRIGVLETLDQVYLKIEQASTDVEVMSVYEKSASTLQTLLADPNLNIGKVEQTMEEVREVLADGREIDEMINPSSSSPAASGSAATTTTAEDQEIADELAALIAAAQPVHAPPPDAIMDDLQSRLDLLMVPQHPTAEPKHDVSSPSALLAPITHHPIDPKAAQLELA